MIQLSGAVSGLKGLLSFRLPFNIIHSALPFALWIICFFFGAQVYASSNASVLVSSQALNPEAVSPESCATCHQVQHKQWQSSHHAKAMLPPSAQNVLADFNHTQALHVSQFARFFVKNNTYFATVWSGNKDDAAKAVTYEVKYTFGIYPLQQYLVSVGDGKMHVLPFAWDTRDKQLGGQRWMHLYTEDITAKDRLHWQQPLQNWNGMCADCHSDDVKRNYDSANDTFDTTWTHVSVGCASCHDGLSLDHAKNPNRALLQDNQSPVGQWLRADGARVAYWQGEPRDNKFMGGCYACHALRSPLTDGFDSDEHFLDQFMPTFTNAPVYHPDGQIKEEAYVYGSFLQSKMHAQGVNCLDCHNSHTYELKFEGNKVCTQCHSPAVFDAPLHHNHKQDTEAAQCVTCHMPTTTYMNVDARRDHSFKVPRPDISHLYGTPNACIGCHTDKSDQWAAKAIASHAAKDGLASTGPLSANEQALLDLQIGRQVDYDRHLAIVKDTSIAPIRRAGALALFRYAAMLLNPRDAKPFINHKEPLMRLAVINALEEQPKYIKSSLILPLLNDEFKAVRVQAAFALAGVKLPAEKSAFYTAAFKEWQVSNKQMQFRGEANINTALVAQKLRDQQSAIDAYLQSISVDPYFAPAYVNLSDIYKSLAQKDKEEALFKHAIKALPQSAVIHYGYGLFHIRQKALSVSIGHLKKAHELERANGQYAYMYYLALHTDQQSKQAYCGLVKYTQENNQQNLIDLARGIRSQIAGEVDCAPYY